MENTNKQITHVLATKFKEGVSAEKIDEIVGMFANLVNIIEPMRSFHWRPNLNRYNKHGGYMDLFETTFDNIEGVDIVYMTHPAHTQFAKECHAIVEHYLVFDYESAPAPKTN